MIVFRQKEFGPSRNQIRELKGSTVEILNKRAMKEIMKIIDMNYDNIGINNQDHWVKKITYSDIPKLNPSSGHGVEILLSLNELPNWEEFIKRVIVEVREKEHNPGETDSKYHLYYRYHPEPTYSIDEWHIIYRYIALCLVGQLNPDLDDFWSSYNKIRRMKVNVNKKVYIEPDQATKILTKAIDSVLSGGGSSVIKKLEV